MDRLVQFPALLFTTAFTSEGLFRPALVTRLQIERVLLDILDDIFLLHLPLEAAQGAFDGFAFLDLYFSQALSTPSSAGIGSDLHPERYDTLDGEEQTFILPRRRQPRQSRFSAVAARRPMPDAKLPQAKLLT